MKFQILFVDMDHVKLSTISDKLSFFNQARMSSKNIPQVRGVRIVSFISDWATKLVAIPHLGGCCLWFLHCRRSLRAEHE